MSASKLQSVIHCPDCGGVVGATTTTEHGPPCTCYEARPAPKPEVRLEDDAGISSSTHGADGSSSGTAATESPAPATEKLCVLCGKNVAGHRRLKDSRGYICLDCARKEQAQQKIQGVKCPKCFRVVKEESLGTHDGRKMCQRCLREAREISRPGSKRFRKIDDKHFETANKTQLIVLSIVAGVLALLMLVGWLSR